MLMFRRLLTPDQRDAFDDRLSKLRTKRDRAKTDATRAKVQLEIEAVKDERRAARKAEGARRADAGTRWYQRALRLLDGIVNQEAMIAYANAERDDAIAELTVLGAAVLKAEDLDAAKAMIVRAVNARVRDIVQDMAEQADAFTDYTAIPGVLGMALEAIDGPVYSYIAHRNEARLRDEIVSAVFDAILPKGDR